MCNSLSFFFFFLDDEMGRRNLNEHSFVFFVVEIVYLAIDELISGFTLEVQCKLLWKSILPS